MATIKISASRLAAFWAEQDPDAPWIIHEGRCVTRGAFERRTNKLARAYAALGVKEGDLVTNALGNGIEAFEATFAIWKLGATPQPVSPLLPKIERDGVIALARPALVVGVDADMLDGVRTVGAGFEPDEHLSDEPLPEITTKIWRAPTSGGSTGRPKIVLAKLPAEFDVPEREAGRAKIPGPRLLAGPFYHAAPFSFAMDGFKNGVPLVVMSKFDASEALRLMDVHKVETVTFVPTMMHRIWSLPQSEREGCDLSALKIVVHTGAPCPAWLKEAWINWIGPERVIEFYGGTEGLGRAFITGNEWLSHKGSVGRPLPGCTLRIVGSDGQDMPVGEIGEVFLLPDGGQGSTYEYVGATSRAIEGGWESLGDMGHVDAEGYLYLADRRSDMILSGGANIYPAEVEAAIEAFAGVRSAAVIGLPDEAMGDLVHAIVDVPEGIEMSGPDLLAFLAERLVRYKIPRTLEFINNPLRNDSGKVRRHALRQARIDAASGESA